MNSGPLSERICSGVLWRKKSSPSSSQTSLEFGLCSTLNAKHSRINSSMMQDSLWLIQQTTERPFVLIFDELTSAKSVYFSLQLAGQIS